MTVFTSQRVLAATLLFGLSLGCGAAGMSSVSGHPAPKCESHDGVASCPKMAVTHHFPPTMDAKHLYVLALGPKDAFTSSDERAELWRALQGAVPSIAPLLGTLEDIPLDYRIEYVFNHTTPSATNAEMHRLRPWAKTLSSSDRRRLQNARTLLLVKGSLARLPNAQETRLTLAALVYLAEKYDGVIFDLLTREAIGVSDLRSRLTPPARLPPQIRLIGVRNQERTGLRTVGLPKYGFPDLFLKTTTPKKHIRTLSAVANALLVPKPLPPWVRLMPCEGGQFDYGCYEVQLRTPTTD